MADLLNENGGESQSPNNQTKTGTASRGQNQTTFTPGFGDATFDMGFLTSNSSEVGSHIVKLLHETSETILARFGQAVGINKPINVETVYVPGDNVGSNVDTVCIYSGPFNGKCYAYLIATAAQAPELTPAAILSELQSGMTGTRQGAVNPLNSVSIIAPDRIVRAVSENIQQLKGRCEVLVINTIHDGRHSNLHDNTVLEEIKNNYLQRLYHAIVGGTVPAKISKILREYNPRSISAEPRLTVSNDGVGTSLDPMGRPVRTDWAISITALAKYDRVHQLLQVKGYNDVVFTNTQNQQGQMVTRAASHLVCTDLTFPAGAASDTGAIILGVTTMNTMAQGSLPIVPFIRMKGNEQRDPMSLEIITHALASSGVDTSKKLPAKLPANVYFDMLMRHFDSRVVARSIDFPAHSPMATLCSDLMEAAIERGGASNEAAVKIHQACDILTDGGYSKMVGDKPMNPFISVYTLPAGYIKQRNGTITDIRIVDAISILTKKMRAPNSSFNHPEAAVATLFSDVKQQQALGMWAAMMNVMAPDTHVTGLMYRAVFDPKWINAITAAVNAAGFAPNILPGDMAVSGVAIQPHQFNNNAWVATPQALGQSMAMQTDFTTI